MTFLHKFILWNVMLVWLGVCYYGPQWWPLSTPCELMPSSLDQAIPFIPNTAWMYQSLFFLLPLGALIQPTKREFLWFLFGFCALVACFSAFFWLLPTQLRAPPDITSASWAYDHLVAGVDGRRNAFPSLHAALTVYAGTSIIVLYRQSPLIYSSIMAWMILLLISTLTTKQHILVDMLAGVLGGTIAFVLAAPFRIIKRLGIA